jgi:anionic cell wall polymer biosynthesis LytR-Cps2A-Psr (LCP) family protein
METVQWNLGIRVHEYLIVDFNAFIGLVDAINGITVTTDYTINDPRYPSMNYGYDPFYLPPGTHELNGYDALRFARTRHGDSDIHRATRQQQVLFAIRDKILDANLLPRLIFQAPTLYASFHDNVNTSLDIDEMIELAWYMKDIPMENIATGVIDFTMLQSYTTGSGAQVLIPIRSRIGQLMVDVFGPEYSE